MAVKAKTQDKTILKNYNLHKGRYLFALLAAVLILSILYFNIANNHFYHKLHSAGLAWPQLKNTYTFGDVTSHPRTYVALGDSLTAGVGTNDFSQSYSYLVAKEIQKSDQLVMLTPLATPGYKTADIIKQYLDKAVALKPDIVTILIGVNDVHGMLPTDSEFQHNYETIVRRLKTDTSADIYAIAIPYIGSNDSMWPVYRNYYGMRTLLFNNDIRKLAQKYNVHYIDLYSKTLPYSTKPSGYYSKDEFHPSAAGYAIWAGVIASDISN